jgi:hypothetical protein
VNITGRTAPTYRTLRPMKATTTPTFPVYDKLCDTLAGLQEHPDPTAAHALATCASYAYSGSDTVSMIMARLGLEENHCLTVAESVDVMFICSTAFLIQSSDGRVVILCYRGTQLENLVDWLADLDVSPEKIRFPLAGAEGTEVHGGFYRNVRATRYEIITALERALNGHSILPDGPPMDHRLESLYLTGHSLGGAMAAMLAVMLTSEPRYAPLADKLKAVYTYGQPMIGTRPFAAACQDDPFLGPNVVRYVYLNDVVPQLPPTASGGFAHFGREFRYRPDGDSGHWSPALRSAMPLPSILELLALPVTLLSGSLRVLRNIPLVPSIQDHLPQHYLAALTPAGVRSEFGD